MTITVTTDDGRKISGRIDEEELGKLRLDLPFEEYLRVVKKIWVELARLEEARRKDPESYPHLRDPGPGGSTGYSEACGVWD